MPQITVIRARKESNPSQRVLVRFSDKSTLEFASVAEARRQIRSWREEIHSPEFLRRLALVWWADRDDTLTTPATLENKTLTVDFTQPVPVEVA